MTSITTRRTARARDQFDDVQVYEPHKAGLPPLGRYLREAWRRRRFARELSRTQLRANHIDSPLGAIWLVLNPLLLACVYFILTLALAGSSKPTALDPRSSYDKLLAVVVGIFTWYLAQNIMMVGATAVTSSGGLILNQSFPRVLLVTGSTINSFTQYLPTIPLYLALLVLGKAGGWTITSHVNATLLWLPLLLFLLVVTSFGLAMLFATMTVFYRDTSKFLSYIVRIWLYLSPVLYTVQNLEHKFHSLGKPMIYLNPLGPALGTIIDVWTQGISPTLTQLVAATFWALFFLLVGGYFFVSRERDFAVRL